MGKKATVNGFTEGLSMDLNALTDTKETLIDALNATLVTGNGNEMILQNDDGNVKIAYKDKDTIQYVSLKEGYLPIGMKEYGGIIYIASINPDPKNYMCELGTYPSPVYDDDTEKTHKITYQYRPLHNYKHNNENDFTTKCFNFSLEHPVTIDIQKSYDNSVNLILNDGYNIPRLINSGFAVTSQSTYEIPIRTNSSTQQYVNEKDEQNIFDIITSLNKRYQKIPKIKFNGVLNNGSLPVGNYVFYFKYSDADNNTTDIIAESGIVSCFQGNNADPSSINGGFRDESSNKSVSFTLSNLDKGFDYIKVSYSRNTSDLDQNRVTSVTDIDYKFSIKDGICNIIISGTENTSSSTVEDLNQQYTILNTVQSETQNSNILFSANVSVSNPRYEDLIKLSQNILPYVKACNAKEKIGEVDSKDYTDKSNLKENTINNKYPYEYYNVKNIYYNLGYWAEEFYRFGIVYIFEDGTLSPVYNVRGCDNLPYYTDKGNSEIIKFYDLGHIENPNIINNIYYDSNNNISNGLQNNKGVVRIKPDKNTNNTERQLYGIGFLNTNPSEKFTNLHIKGFFFVRQKRLPTILCQAYLMPNDSNSNLPYLYRKRYTENGTDESNISPFYVQNSDQLDIKKYRLGLVGESFLWYSGDQSSKEFQYKSDPPNYYIKIPEGVQRYGYTGNYLTKGTVKYLYFSFNAWIMASVEDMSLKYDQDKVISVQYTFKILSVRNINTQNINILRKLSSLDLYEGITFIGYSSIDPYSLIFSISEGDSLYYIYDNPNGIDWALDAKGTFFNVSKSAKIYEQYLDYEGRLFYFPLYNPNCEYVKHRDTYFEDFPYEKYVNRSYRWSAYSPDYMIKQPYYNQFFTGGKLKAKVSDISTGAYSQFNNNLYNTNTFNNEFVKHIKDTHKYITQEGNTYNGKFRQYYVDNLCATKNSKYEDIYCVSLTDSSSVGSTNDNKQSIFRAIAGNQQEAIKCRQYYCNLTDTDKENGKIGDQPYQGNNSILNSITTTDSNNNTISLPLKDKDYYNTSPNVRGIYSPYIGITIDTPDTYKTDYTDDDKYREYQYIGVGEIINIYIPGFKSEINTYRISNNKIIENDKDKPIDLEQSAIYQYLNIRMHDSSAYYAISDRLEISELVDTVCYRGDCYFSTYTQRINRNFQDPSVPTNDIVVDNETWNKYGIGSKDNDYSKLNSGDVNAAPLGSWVTFKCATNYNLSIRSKDESHTSEKALTGQARSFCPLTKPDISGSSKIAESETMNDGFNTTVGDKQYFTIEDSQYIQTQYKNRIYYSNVSQESSFTNGYRVVKSVNFRDYNPEYGSITKILPYQDDLIVVFEHGIGVGQIYEKNLITQNTNSEVFINSNNILPLKLTILSDSIGSQWKESIIKTPYYIYGIDTSAKKIWRLNDLKVEIISDFKVESFLNKNINITSKDTQPKLGIRNIKSHYNAQKNEVMFTYYDNSDIFNKGLINTIRNGVTYTNKYNYIQWNLAYNEINKCFITFYSWLPAYSENIDNTFYSFDNYLFIYQTIHEQIPIKYLKPNIAYLYRHGINDPIKDRLQDIPKPCYWYDNQEPFEFEFTVRDDPSVQKIWNNLQIISNKAEPQSFHFEIVGDSYEFKKDKPNMYFRQEATKELWHNVGSSIKYDTDYTKHAIPNYEYTILNRYTTESPYQNTKGVSKSTYFPLYYKRYKKKIDIEHSVEGITDFTHQKIWDWRYLSGSEIIYDDKTNEFNIDTHIQCIPRSKYGTLRGNADYIEDKWEVQIPLINMVQKNEQKWENGIPPIVIDQIPTDIKSQDIDFSVLPKFYQTSYWPKNLDLLKWTATKQMPIRDKYIKIRIRYDGTEKAIISAIKTIYTESFA